jgi:hypothetical protein
MSRQSFEQLEIETVTVEEEETVCDDPCSVCIENFKKGDLIKTLPECKHKFHETCLKAWYDSSDSGDTCPVCRRRFSQPVELSEDEINFAAEQAYYSAVLGLGNFDFDHDEVRESFRSQARRSQRQSSGSISRFAINS